MFIINCPLIITIYIVRFIRFINSILQPFHFLMHSDYPLYPFTHFLRHFNSPLHHLTHYLLITVLKYCPKYRCFDQYTQFVLQLGPVNSTLVFQLWSTTAYTFMDWLKANHSVFLSLLLGTIFAYLWPNLWEFSALSREHGWGTMRGRCGGCVGVAL